MFIRDYPLGLLTPFSGDGRMMLIGDPRQLPPVVKSASLPSDDIEIDLRLQHANYHRIHPNIHISYSHPPIS